MQSTRGSQVLEKEPPQQADWDETDADNRRHRTYDASNTKADIGHLLSRDYIQIRSPVYIPHSAGRYAVKRFRKANCPIIERLTNSLMMHGRNNGKKLMAVRIVAHAFEIVSCLAKATTIGRPGWQ